MTQRPLRAFDESLGPPLLKISHVKGNFRGSWNSVPIHGEQVRKLCFKAIEKSISEKKSIITCRKRSNIFLHGLFLSQLTNRKHKAIMQKPSPLRSFKAKMDETKHPEYRNRICVILSWVTLSKPLAHIGRSFQAIRFALGKCWNLWK